MSSIVWSDRGRVRMRGKRNIGKDYKKVKFNGVKCKDVEIKGTFKVGDVVLIHNWDGDGDWVAQILSLIEWPQGAMRVTLRWFYKHVNVPEASFDGDNHPGQRGEELFYTDNVTPDGANPVEVIKGPAKVFPTVDAMNAYDGATPKFLVEYYWATPRPRVVLCARWRRTSWRGFFASRQRRRSTTWETTITMRTTSSSIAKCSMPQSQLVFVLLVYLE